MDPLTPRATPLDVDVVPFQLAPALAVASGIPRVLLADEVGLGKTIQAGWIIGDLMARNPSARILLAVPASVRHQWIEELARRFGVFATAADARWLRAMVADLPENISPWTPPGVYATSLDFLKRPDVAASAAQHVWDAVVVDEAHTATAPTDRYAALSTIAGAARRVILITATPYSGDPASFASMIAIGATSDAPAPLLFRRTRHDVGDPRRRRHRFAAVRLTGAESRLQRLLERYSRIVWKDAPDSSARLAVTILRKRALSSPAAAARSLRRRLDLLSQRASLPRQLTLWDEDDEIDDEEHAAALAAPGMADAPAEQRWLHALIAAADSAAAHDSKQLYLHRLLRRLRGESVVVFTEYRDTLFYLGESLPRAVHLHGAMSSGERAAVQARFNRDGGLLLCTDAAAEGLNLHGRCRTVVNYELPWNPARLEQRIGRVDRIGQQRAVHAVSLTARDTAEQLVIANLVRRLSRVAATLGEGDRLAGFLDEARVARIVIADEASALSTPELQYERAKTNRRGEDHAAEQLRARGRAPGAAVTGSTDVLVSSIRASQALRAGYVVVFASTAQTPGGRIAARGVDALFIAAPVERPRTAAAARTSGEMVLAAIPEPLSLLASRRPWLERVATEHASAIDREVARERSLGEKPRARSEIQAGLFDRRAVSAAEGAAERETRAAAEHRRRIEALLHERELTILIRPVAVLIVWR